jgi:hypothetical protein
LIKWPSASAKEHAQKDKPEVAYELRVALVDEIKMQVLANKLYKKRIFKVCKNH